MITIWHHAFHDCIGLESVTFPSSLRNMGEHAFDNCRALERVDLSGTQVKKIPRHAFQFCSDLVNVIFPDSLKKIDGHAFYGCDSLTSVTLQPTVKIVEDDPFLNMTFRAFPDGVEIINNTGARLRF